jgi:hypothetical protein
MGTELVPETLYSNELTRLCARDDYIESCRRESFKTYIIKKLYKPNLQIIICGDININYLLDTNKKKQLNIVLNSFNLYSTVHFPTRIKNESSTMIDNIFFDTTQFNNFIVFPILNGLSDHDTQLLLLQDLNSDIKNNCNSITTIRKIDNSSMVEFKIRLNYGTMFSMLIIRMLIVYSTHF